MRKAEASQVYVNTQSKQKLVSPILILLSVCPGTFLSHFSAGLVNIALPDLSLYFQAELGLTQWIVTGYLLMVMLCLPIMGKLSDQYGKRRIHNMGYYVFGTGILLSALSFSLGFLLAARVIQGAGAAMLQAANMAIITESYPDEKRGKALGIIGTAVGVGALLGPSVGGLLINWFSWQLLFWIQLPIVIVSIVLATRFIPKDKPAQKGGSFDYIGAALFGIALTLSIFVLNQIGEGEVNSHLWLICFIAAASFVVFFRWVTKKKEPFINLKVLAPPMVGAGSFIIVISYMATFSAMVVIPFYLRGILEISPSLSGLLLMSYPLLLAVIGPISGTFSDRFGSYIVVLIGLSTMIASLLGLTLLSNTTPLLFVIFLLCSLGFAMGILTSPNYNLMIGYIPIQYLGFMTSTIALLRNFGMILGTAIGVTFMNLFVDGSITEWMLAKDETNIGNVMLGFRSFFLLVAILTIVATGYLIIKHRKMSKKKEISFD
ncbi:MFS transporter [Aquibacillus albus]|uniref:EmrB/QacA subfamily drug resistance transporter n=1 Tax=Aquibacillus albus TaxID=1168171 RepID=A0ABS2N5L3_9BACI|nr:MFS transporter [Aquibacillus albus]MBM7573407.1 EmrB/QacA subfamily drug resistance transporter [Aquibacillus albus]